MNREVKLSISGLHVSGENDENSVADHYEAEYFKKNDSHYLIYEDVQEGFSQPSKTRIKCKDKLMELTRQGLTRTHMVFEENRTHMTPYVTPYGEFLLGIHTKRVCMEEQDKQMVITVEYSLEADGEPLSDCRIVIKAQDK